MCGIGGVIGKQLSADAFQNMMQSIAHRGPDHSAIFQHHEVSLGHHRLSIIETSSQGNQPMISKDGRWVLVYNGAIYNHLLLRETHLKNAVFSSQSDTETLLLLWQKLGVESLPLLQGMFAFCMVDMVERECYLVRDKVGIKPLYYRIEANQLTFCSELKGIVNAGGEGEIHPQAAYDFVSFLWTYPERTIVKSIHILPAGNYLRWKNGSSVINPYTLPVKTISITSKPDEELEKLLLTVVEQQLLAEVPVGLSLSGGLDSSLLLALMSGPLAKKNIPCYTADVGNEFQQEGFGNDLAYAKKVAKLFKADLQIVPALQFSWVAFDKMVWQCDGPVSDLAALFMGNVAQVASAAGTKVLLTGLGADEVFSGYRRHVAFHHSKWVKWVAKINHGLEAFISPAWKRRMKKVALSYNNTPAKYWNNLWRWLPEDEAENLMADQLFSQIEHHPFQQAIEMKLTSTNNSLQAILSLDREFYLPAHNLHYADRMSMLHGVEMRVPYLDEALVKWASSLSNEQLISGRKTKVVLKKVSSKYLPKEVVHRTKTGFGWPLRRALQSNNLFAHELEQRVMADILYQQPLFNKQAVTALFCNTLKGKTDGVYSLMAIAAVGSWLQQFHAAQIKSSK